MKNIYKSFLLLMVASIFSVSAFSQANIVAQSFEGSGDWYYSEFPNPYTVYSPPTDIWGICGNTYVSTTSTPQIYNHGDVVAPFFGNISSASEGTHYYGMQDINNPYTSTLSGTWPADPGTNWHILTFDPVTLPGGGTFPIKVAFDYYTDGFDGTDYIGWEIAWDNDTVWSGLTTTNYSNTDAWTTEEFTAPAGVTHVRLRVAAKQNGGTDFGAFDNFRVFLDVGDLTPPTITSLDVANDSTLVLTTSESVTNGSDISNYSGVAVSSASVNANGDTITLSLSTPLVVGQYTDVYVAGLADPATNMMTNDTLIVVFNNTDLSSGLTITELMYNDPGNYDNLDYIELYNNSVNTIALGGLRIDDAISFVFPEFDLLAGEYAILAKDAFSGSSPCNTYPAGCGFETFFGFAPTFEWSTGYLSTSGEQITILNTLDGIVVDLDYDDSWASGIGDGDGYSIVLCDPSTDINVDTNWTAAIPSVNPACDSCTIGLGIGTTTIYAHPMADCPPVVYGCMDTLALNYDINANIDDGSCTFSSNLGCIDSTAINYDATASIDDGSCTYPIPPMVNLFFSEYAEGSSNNKYFEIYNPTSDTVDLANYAFPTVSNAPTTIGVYEYWNDFPLGSVILPNDVYIVGHPYSDVAISGFSDHTYTYLSNGDDGLALVYGSNPGTPMDPTAGDYVIVDFIGDWNGDPGSGWDVAGTNDATKDHTLVRKCDVTQGNDDWIASAGTDAVNSEWIVMPIDDWNDLGVFTPCTSITYGCMDATANNYDAAATIDDGSCTYSILGCTDSTAFNYDPLANTDDGSCVAVVPGCTDATATNYDATANTDDGTCTFFNTILGCTDSLAFNYDPLANTDDGSCEAVVLGCTDAIATNYDATANTDDGSCLATMVNLYFSEYAEGSSNNKYFEIYNPTSDTVDLSSYAYPSTSNAPTTVGVYEYWNEFDAGAVILPNDVYIVAHGSSDPIILAAADETHNYLSNGDDGYALVYGSNPGSPVDAATGGYIILDFIGDWNGDPGSGWDVAGTNDATKDHTLVRKCDVTQGNDDWVASAGTDAVNSEWIVMPINDWNDLGVFTPCTSITYGCMDATANNYDAAATIDDGSCIYDVLGCTDSTASNYDPLANTDDGSCNYDVLGCTDPIACNYSSIATLDDGSCISPINITSHFINAGMYYYTPSNLVVNIGDTVTWLNDAGYHDVNGNINSLTGNSYNNPVSFYLPPTSGPSTIGSYVFTVAGTYNYDCSIGSHAANGMVGSIVVNAIVSGCTDPIAINYDPSVGCDDGSCNYNILGCTDLTATNYDATANTDDGSCIYPVAMVNLYFSEYAEGSSNNKYFEIYNPTSDTVDLSSYAYPSTSNAPTTVGVYEYWNEFDAGAVILPNDVYIVAHGSSDPIILAAADETHNYLSNGDDGYALVYGSNPGSPVDAATGGYVIVDWLGDWNADPGSGWDVAGTNDATKDHTLVRKCDVTQGNDDWVASAGTNVTDSEWEVLPQNDWTNLGFHTTPCATVSGCMDVQANNYDAAATVDDGSCTYDVLGCTDATANNYDATATIDDGSCTYDVLGCTDTTALNYDASANTDDGSCTYCVDGCTDATQFNYDPNATCDDGTCIPFTYGCIDSSASNYNSTVNTDDGSCIWLGCTDAAADNYDAIATVDDGSCTYTVVDGCTDPTADNYDATATVDDGSCTYTVLGCTDATAANYDATATVDDGSCTYTVCNEDSPTGAVTSELTHDRVRITWDNMNSSTCMVEQYRIRYREAGTSVWSSKTMSGSGLCQFGLNTTTKKILGLTPSTTYEYYMKAWYCGGGSSAWSALQNFTTGDPCLNVDNFSVSTPTTTKAVFAWDLPASAYDFVRIKLRVDTTNAIWTTAGGFGVFYPAIDKAKNGLNPGTSYIGAARTWCDPNGGTYRSASWSSFIYWTQPTSVRIDGGAAIANLDVYPNPSRDVFNVAFTSEDVQDLEVRVINVVGEVVYTENLQQFVGEYTKQINLKDNAKGIYFLEIETNDRVVNKKLILQ